MSVFSDVNMYIGIYNNDAQVLDEYSINQSIMTILCTQLGQRPFRPEFGSNIYNLLWLPMNSDTASMLNNNTILAIERWETRIVITDSSVIPDYNTLSYYVSLDYVVPSLQNASASFAMSFSKQTG